MNWIKDHWEFLTLLVPIIVDILNRITKHWTERKTRAGRAIAWVLEAANLLTIRKPTLRHFEQEAKKDD